MDISSSKNYEEIFPPDFDMIDTPSDSLLYEPFHTALLIFNKVLTPTYLLYDQSAIKKQHYHIIVTKLFIATGTLAVVAVTLQLINKSLDLPPVFNLPSMAIEMIVTLFALLAVIGGIISSFHRQWLLDRHKAELIRFLKFRYLLDPRLWQYGGFSLEDFQRDLNNAVREIEMIRYKDIDRWLTDIVIPKPVPNLLCPIENELILFFMNYYRKKRVQYQKRYYCGKIRQLVIMNKRTIRIPMMLFFLGIVAVLGHFIIDVFNDSSPILGTLSVILAGCAIILPFAGVAVRSLRLSREITRGTMLFKAKYSVLDDMDNQLQKLSERPHDNFNDSIRIVKECEEFLRTEHHEWLILIKSSEYLI